MLTNEYSSYQQLSAHFADMKAVSLLDLFAQDTNRATRFSQQVEGIYVDYAKNNITQETLRLLIALAQEAQLPKQIDALFTGKKINISENRAVLHTLLRSSLRRIKSTSLDANNNNNLHSVYEHDINSSLMLDGLDASKLVATELLKIKDFSDQVRQGVHRGFSGKKITDIVSIGIGGSHLGPKMVYEALITYATNKNATIASDGTNGIINTHFLSSVDPDEANQLLATLNPATTLFIIVSKTFTTQETLANASVAKEWFLAHFNNNKHDLGGNNDRFTANEFGTEFIKNHFVAVSTNQQLVTEFGIDPINMFTMWDFVGGRYSVWSAVGLAIVLAFGFDIFMELLNGAKAMDEHFRYTQNLQHNLPVVLALISIWQVNFYNYKTQLVSPYNTNLRTLPAYIQQLQMESNGKSVTSLGVQVNYDTQPVIWGASGIDGQHAYYQMLHQGTNIHPMDIIVALKPKPQDLTTSRQQKILLANAIAQAQAFMTKRDYKEVYNSLLKDGVEQTVAVELAKHKCFAGNRPTNMIILRELNAYNLGSLLALYEHKTFVQGVIWGVNSFDQMGVELGKVLAKDVLASLNIDNSSPVESNAVHMTKQHNLANTIDKAEANYDDSTLSIINYVRQII